MSQRVQDKVTVITGGASGIGAGTAKRFVEEGGKVVIADLQFERAQALAEELGNVACAIRTDVTNEDDMAAAVDMAVSAFGRLDCMINNAGIVGAVGRLHETPLAAWEKTMAVHLTGAFLGMKHAARVMVPQKSGVILSLSSTAGFLGGLGPHAYTAAKHAIIGLTKSAASEYAQYGIRVNAVAPGNTVTDMTSDALAGDVSAHDAAAEAIANIAPLGIAGFPSDIANALLYLASDEARYVTSHTLVVDSGQTTMQFQREGSFHEQDADVMREAGKRGV
ncbi:MAG: glucose 1-dehydrogenase [Pseudomonadota bacterium]